MAREGRVCWCKVHARGRASAHARAGVEEHDPRHLLSLVLSVTGHDHILLRVRVFKK